MHWKFNIIRLVDRKCRKTNEIMFIFIVSSSDWNTWFFVVMSFVKWIWQLRITGTRLSFTSNDLFDTVRILTRPMLIYSIRISWNQQTWKFLWILFQMHLVYKSKEFRVLISIKEKQIQKQKSGKTKKNSQEISNSNKSKKKKNADMRPK